MAVKVIERVGVDESEYVGSAPGRRRGTILMRDGLYIHPLELRTEDLKISYMLHGLPNVCRFTGSLMGATWGSIFRRTYRKWNNPTAFYPVAQHQTIGARYFLAIGERELARWFSLHDGVEFAIGDVSRPIKYQPEMRFFRDAEHEAQEKLAHRYDLSWPEPPEIKIMDNRMLATEVRDLMGDPSWDNLGEPLPSRIEPWTAKRAFYEYRDLLTELGLWARSNNI